MIDMIRLIVMNMINIGMILFID